MNSCLICEGKTRPLFSLGLQPLANKYPKSIEDFPMEVVREMTAFYCTDCNYINLPCDIDRSIFFEDYYYLSSVNRELVDHFEDFADHIKGLGAQFVLDVGSNDGILLRPLKALGLKCLGIDPSENVSQIANREGLETLVGFFDLDITQRIEVSHGKPDLICASSVFTHLDNPLAFFITADRLLEKGGAVIVEVEYMGSIVESLAFERFYFDRPHYYSVKALSRIAKKAGFQLSEVSFVNAHGGSVRAVFHRHGASEPSLMVKETIEAEENSLSEAHILAKFNAFEIAGSQLVLSVEKMLAEGKRIAAYGCPARFSTITNFCGIGKSLLPYVVDDSPLKSGRFSPGRHIPIVPFSTAENVDAYVVFAYEYVDSIRVKVNASHVEYFKPIPFQKL